MSANYEDSFENPELYDTETMLYNSIVFSTFLRRANAPKLLPVSLILMEISGDIPHGFMVEISGVLQDMAKDNFMLARTNSNRIAIFMSHTLDSDAYDFLELYSSRLRDCSLLDTACVRAAIKSWESAIQLPLDFYNAAKAELASGLGMNLKFVGNSRLGGN